MQINLIKRIPQNDDSNLANRCGLNSLNTLHVGYNLDKMYSCMCPSTKWCSLAWIVLTAMLDMLLT